MSRGLRSAVPRYHLGTVVVRGQKTSRSAFPEATNKSLEEDLPSSPLFSTGYRDSISDFKACCRDEEGDSEEIPQSGLRKKKGRDSKVTRGKESRPRTSAAGLGKSCRYSLTYSVIIINERTGLGPFRPLQEKCRLSDEAGRFAAWNLVGGIGSAVSSSTVTLSRREDDLHRVE